MQQVTRREAYERLRPVLASMEDEFYEQVKGRGVAKYEEQDDGGATISVLGIDYPLFARNPDGTVHAYNYNGQRCNYSLFNSPWRRHVVLWVTTLDKAIEAAVFELANQQPWYDKSEEHAAAASRHAHRITGRLIRPVSIPDRIRHLNKTLYRLYDPNLFKLLVRVTWGYDRDALSYNILKGVTNPHDVPPSVLAAYINLARKHQQGDIDEPDHRDPIEVTQYVRETLAQHGALRRATWRYLLRLPARHVAYVIERAHTPHALRFLNLLAQTGETPRWTTLRMLLNALGHLKGNRGDDFDEQQFVQYARMLTRHTAKMRGIIAFRNLEPHSLVLDWLASGVNLTPTQAALPYTWWRERAQEWHDDPNGPVQQRLREQRARNRYYAAEQAAMAPIRKRHHQELTAALAQATAEYAVGQHAHRGITITPLTTSAQLEHEGAVMNHCVGGYDGAVMRGVSRIYHLEGKGTTSTIELRHDHDQWYVSQHHGPKNRPTTDEHKRAGRALARAYNEAHAAAHENLLADLSERHQRELHEAKMRARREVEATAQAAGETHLLPPAPRPEPQDNGLEFAF